MAPNYVFAQIGSLYDKMPPSPVSDLLPSSHDCAVCTEVQDIYRILQLEDQQARSKNVSRGRKPLGVNIYRLLFVGLLLY